ncbi:Rv1355c family protein [Nocardia halotolerans]|uniref:Rv1355c family protein n=1 Tax=Nocardia halotolerans TaxID=1755878 RepID=A0ABV8VLQ9_9NOCA
MTDTVHPNDVFRPVVLDDSSPEDAAELARLRREPGIELVDLREPMRTELRRVNNPPDADPAQDRWVYYPWRRALRGIVGAQAFRAIRLDRNRNKLTRQEQAALATRSIGVVGQSVGHAVAYTLALEGSCGLLRLADFDTVELSNLNRIPAGLFDIGVNKCVVTARRIAELDPYLPVQVYPEGIDDESMDRFLDGLSVVLEECDSLDVKFAVREGARRHRIPLLMDTSDRGLFDVERFDLEPDRPPFHGLLGATTGPDLRGLTTREKAPHVMRILDPRELSARMAASLAEIDETVTTWPQLGGDIQLGAAIAAAAVRRLGLGQELASGRVRVDLERALDELTEPAPVDFELPAQAVEVEDTATGTSPRALILEAVQRAPSGGNTQPWSATLDGDVVRIDLDPSRTSTMDVGYRGSAVAIGAALHNARAAAAAHGLLGPHQIAVNAPDALSVTLRLGDGGDAELAGEYPQVRTRATNRHLGDGAEIDPRVLAELTEVAARAGANLYSVTDRDGIVEAAELLGESDRIRYLTPRLHAEMFSELRWPTDDLRTGLDVRSLELAPDEQAKLQIGRRPDVMERLRSWSAGRALGEYTRDRVTSSSAVIVVSVAAEAGAEPDLSDYVRGGTAVQKVWFAAQRHDLAVQPVSPVFLYARDTEDLRSVSAEFTDTLTSVHKRFFELIRVPVHEAVALVLRLSCAPAPTIRSSRLPVLGSGNNG